ncbi:MAG: c-type cytochrome [Melioribacteraceae bacterium]|nr:c-type cytochrome [Melioribacteraceae bacterium]
MEILDKIVLHQSAHHMELIKYLLVLTHFLFIGYAGLLLGSLILSIYFRNRFNKTNEKKYYLAVKKIIDLATFNKGASFTFAIVPLLSAMFGYSQLLHLTNINIALYLFWSAIFLFISLIFIYSFKYSIHLRDIFQFADQSNIESDDVKTEIQHYKSSTNILYLKSGKYGLFLLLVAIYFYSVASQLAVDLNNWNNNRSFFVELFSINSITYFLQFIIISLIITSLIILYKYFRVNSEELINDEELKSFLKNFSLKILLSFSLIYPLLILLNSFSKPVLSLSFNFFGLIVVVFILVLFIVSLTYVMLKEDSLKYVTSIVFIFFITLFLNVVKEQSVFDTSTKSHFAFLSNEYINYEKNLIESAGLLKVTVNGADIYNGKCIACHQFDRKLVGPAHNDVLPKYEGKKAELVKFILNPVKVNPEYPAMPNQGLKPSEAEAVADYLLANYKKK